MFPIATMIVQCNHNGAARLAVSWNKYVTTNIENKHLFFYSWYYTSFCYYFSLLWAKTLLKRIVWVRTSTRYLYPQYFEYNRLFGVIRPPANNSNWYKNSHSPDSQRSRTIFKTVVALCVIILFFIIIVGQKKNIHKPCFITTQTR